MPAAATEDALIIKHLLILFNPLQSEGWSEAEAVEPQARHVPAPEGRAKADADDDADDALIISHLLILFSLKAGRNPK